MPPWGCIVSLIGKVVIDFTNLKQRKKTYAGANGNKISVIYEGEQYMLKCN